VDRRVKDTLRASATAVGAAAGLLALASTAQTPDGYIHASFGGPLDVFSTGSADVLAIGDGTNDATELAALLKGPVGPTARNGAPNSPYRVAYEAGAAPNVTTGSMIVPLMDDQSATAAPSSRDTAILPSKPVVDSQGKIDCSGAVSCHTDTTTNITTVTYPDGVVAIVQKINDLTVVAYKTITEVLPSEISALLPPVPTAPAPPLLAAVAPPEVPAATPSAPVVEPEPVVAAPTPETVPGSIDPGPPAPDLDLDLSDLDLSDGGPRLNVTTPPNDFSPGHAGTGADVQLPKIPALERIKDAIGDLVKGPVGNAMEDPGPSGTAESSAGSPTAGPPTSDGGAPASNAHDSQPKQSDNSGGDGSNGS
jgi:hypothetical protein